MNKITKTILVEASILGVFILVLGLVYFKGAEGTAPQGMKATTASSTVRSLQVGPQQLKTIFSNGDCVSRIITTYSQPIFLYFASSSETGGHSNPGEQFGHIQGASSTVAYDSGLYGCSDVRVYAVASTTPTLTEFKGFR